MGAKQCGGVRASYPGSDRAALARLQGRLRAPIVRSGAERLRRGTPAEAIGQKPKPRSGGPDVAVTQIRGLLGGELIFALQGGQPVLGEGWHPDIVGGLEIDPEHAGRVPPKDQLLYPPVRATMRGEP